MEKSDIKFLFLNKPGNFPRFGRQIKFKLIHLCLIINIYGAKIF